MFFCPEKAWAPIDLTVLNLDPSDTRYRYCAKSGSNLDTVQLPYCAESGSI